MSRRDDVSKTYDSSNVIQSISNYLFILITIVSLATLFATDCPKEILIVFQIVMVIVSTSISVVDDFWLWYSAEAMRRKSALESAFNIDMTGLQTDGYYNNTLSPSIDKFIVNIYESAYFSYNISKKMLLKESAKAIIAIIIFVVACLEIQNGEIVLLIAQTVFSGQYIVAFLALIFYNFRVDRLCGKFYEILVSTGVVNQKQQTCLLAAAIEYEAIKAHYRVRLSSKVYNKNNVYWSRKWAEIEEKIRISYQ